MVCRFARSHTHTPCHPPPDTVFSYLAIFGVSTESGDLASLPKNLGAYAEFAPVAFPPDAGFAQNSGSVDDDDDDDDMVLTCKVCKLPVKASKLQEHSLTCAVKTAELAYRCLLCTKVFKIVPGRSFPICPNCQSAYVTDLGDRKVSQGDTGLDRIEDEGEEPLSQDNSLLLYFNLKLFPNEDERLVYFFRTAYVSGSTKERSVYFVLSNHAVYLLAVKPRAKHVEVRAEPEKFFKVATSFELKTLISLVVGPGKQTLTFQIQQNMVRPRSFCCFLWFPLHSSPARLTCSSPSPWSCYFATASCVAAWSPNSLCSARRIQQTELPP